MRERDTIFNISFEGILSKASVLLNHYLSRNKEAMILSLFNSENLQICCIPTVTYTVAYLKFTKQFTLRGAR